MTAPPPNPCEDGSHTCAPAAQCVHHGGRTFSCACLPGYAGNGHQCTGEYLQLSALETADSHLGHTSPHSQDLSQKGPLPSFDSHNIGMAQRERKGVLWVRKRAWGDLPWTRLLSISGFGEPCRGWRNLGKVRKSPHSISLLIGLIQRFQSYLIFNCYSPA